MSSSPIPIATYGKNSQITQGLRERLLPQYEMAHICVSYEAALHEFPAVCAGDLETEQSSGLGSNAELPPAERKVPRAVILGGGVPEHEVQAVRQAVLQATVDKEQQPMVVHLTREDILAAGGQGPDPELIGRLLREKLASLQETA
ncbi:hypothetical protein QBC46DRAFT_384098 [Diplogelasinospora grovesii]|uniref:Uncharacterized protein n=1 Tax=Diplogelasinospora grovesii TaxID=303347 RepID=A0AAN6N8T6_9PEZI|nr:hypothetical protein QBC46DRAFT_384098 [Diplogelasinospora grovesii]